MAKYWFKPKTHGYGAAPIGWRGWAAILGYVAAVAVISLPLVVWPALHKPGALVASLVVWLLLLLTVGFVRISRARTDGEWRWRWGSDDRK